MKKMRVAIIGQGRSGRDIHGRYFISADNDCCEVACVVEADEERRAAAKERYGCDVVADYTELFGRKDIDVVVNASYSHQHYPISKDLLEHGFNVLAEKPFGRNNYECQDLINTAKKNGVIITAFQQSLYNPAFLNVKKIIESGKLGEIFQINLKYSGFARRWDWQTLQSRCAGGVFNTGPHPIGQALDFLGWDDQTEVAFSSLQRVLTSGDSDDCAKIILKTPNKPIVDIEVNSADAFASDYTFKVYGSKGTLVSTNAACKVKYVEDFSQYPERPVIYTFLKNEKGEPMYCSEKLDFVEEETKIEGSSFDYGTNMLYHMLYRTIMEGAALEVTPEMAMKVVNVIARCHAENPLSVMFD